jgi:DNA-binding NarL/FixJ family response regulator
MTTRIVLVDHHLMVRHGLRQLLDAEPDLEVVAEAGDSRRAIDVVLEQRPDVVVMDLDMPELDGIAATRCLRDRYPEVHIVVLANADDDTLAVAAVRAGAIGYLSKAVSSEGLLQTVRAAARGHVSFSPAASALLVEALHRPAHEPEQLTARELEVLGYVAQGLSNKEIASKLRISEKTVKSHVSTILGKFGMESRTQAAIHATRTGLVSVDRIACSAADRLRQGSVISIEARRHRPLAGAALA